MTKILLSIVILSIVVAAGNAQNTFPVTGAAGIGTTSPNTSSLLEIRSTNKGMLIPRMTQAQRDAIVTPATGLLIYQTNNTPSFYWYTGSGWKSLSDAATNLSNLSATAVNSSLLPGITGTIDLGSNTKKWRSGYFLGNVRVGSLNIDSSLRVAKGGISSTTNTGYGVSGESTSGSGVYGKSSSATGYGVYGYNKTSGAGVYGYSSSGQGVAGFSSSNYGVYGFGSGAGSTGVHGEGGAYGVYGTSSSNNGIGIYGFGSGTGSTGVQGEGGTYGIYGTSYSNNGIGIYGLGTGSVSTGVYGRGNTVGIQGSSDNIGVEGFGKGGVYGEGSDYGIYGVSTTVGVRGYGAADVDGPFGYGVGVYGRTLKGKGVYGYSRDDGIGVDAESYYGTALYAFSAYGTGIFALCGDGSDNGIYSRSAYGNGGNFTSFSNDAIYAKSDNRSAYAGKFDGKVYMADGYVTSDKNLKKNVEDFKSAMSIINKLKPRYYEFKDDAKYSFLNLPQGKHYGLLAQELEKILPNLVDESWHREERFIMSDLKPTLPGKQTVDTSMAIRSAKPKIIIVDSIKVKAVNYIELIPIVIKGMQELSIQNEKLKSQNEDQQKQIDELRSMMLRLNQNFNSCACAQSSAINQQSAANSNSQTVNISSASLGQNIPNPFNHTTTINYTLPQSRNGGTSAKIIITDKTGKVLKEINLPAGRQGVSGSGKGSVSVDASILAGGTYNYSLYVAGKMVDTKQMVLAK